MKIELWKQFVEFYDTVDDFEINEELIEDITHLNISCESLQSLLQIFNKQRDSFALEVVSNFYMLLNSRGATKILGKELDELEDLKYMFEVESVSSEKPYPFMSPGMVFNFIDENVEKLATIKYFLKIFSD